MGNKLFYKAKRNLNSVITVGKFPETDPVCKNHWAQSVISSFWYKVRDTQLFLSIEYLESIKCLLIGQISVLLYQGIEGLRRGRKMGKTASQWSSQHAQFFFRYICHLMWAWFLAPQISDYSNISDDWLLITDRHNKYNDEKVWNIATITKM